MNAHEAIAEAVARAFVAFPTCDEVCRQGNAHSATCRSRRHRLARGRKPQGYVVTDEDRAAIERVSQADRLPDRYFAGQRMTITRTDQE